MSKAPTIGMQEWRRGLLLTATSMTFVLIVLGGVVCITDSSRGCPDWPGCYGQIYPPLRTDSILEYTHRLVAGLTSLLILGSTILAWCKPRAHRWVRWPPTIALAFLGAVVIFGAMVVLRGLPPFLAMLDVASALLVLALMVLTATISVSVPPHPNQPIHLAWSSAHARLTLVTLLGVWLVLFTGPLVAQSGSYTRCLGWPLLAGTQEGAGSIARFALGFVVTLSLIAVVARGLHESVTPIKRRAAALVGLFLAGELAVNVLVTVQGISIPWLLIYATLATGLWTCLVVYAALTALPQ